MQRKCACGGTPGPTGECAACCQKREAATLQRAASHTAVTPAVPGIVHEVLRSPGQPLDATIRSVMEPRFGHDFSQVRVHADEKSAKSAQTVNALAYTVGNHLVFGPGQYEPNAAAGRRLVAHELTHVLQQRGGTTQLSGQLEIGAANDPYEREAEDLASEIHSARSLSASGVTPTATRLQRVCGATAIGSVGGCTGVGGEDITDVGFSSDNLFRFIPSCDDFRPGEEARLRARAGRIAFDETVEVHGFASEEGDPTFNENLSCARAHLAAAILAQESVVAPLTLFNHGATPGARDDRRSVVLNIHTPSAPATPANPCDPATLPNPATTFEQYVQLVRCVEAAFPSFTPRQVLSLLRQLYYGNQSWSRTRSRFWENVIPCGLSIADPRPGLGTDLFRALRASQVVGGVDIGHVFTGLEAMVCPSLTVELETPGPNTIVSMPNEEFATWGGDLGSAAAHKTHDEVDRSIVNPWTSYFGRSGTPASQEDLEGDIDSYVVRAGLSGAACGSTAGTTIPSLSSPISHILFDYYRATSTPIGVTRADYPRCFVQAIGGTVAGRRIMNKSALVTPIRNRVESFARTFYLGLVTVPLFAIGPVEAMRLLQYSWEATELFLDWLESKL